MASQIEIRDYENNHLGILELEDDDDFPLAINASLQDITVLEKRQGIFSKNFKIPATKPNNLTLEKIYDVNIGDIKKITNKKPIRVVADGLQYEDINYLRITEVEIRNLKPVSYTAVVYGENNSWVGLLDEININSLDFGTITYNYTTVLVSMINLPGLAVRFCPVSYGQWLHGNFIHTTDLRPHILIYSILQKAFTQIGYTIQSDFFQSSLMQNLYYLFTGNGWSLTKAQQDAKIFDMQSNGDVLQFTDFGLQVLSPIPFNIPVSNAGGNYNAGTDKYEGVGYMNFKIRLMLRITSLMMRNNFAIESLTIVPFRVITRIIKEKPGATDCTLATFIEEYATAIGFPNQYTPEGATTIVRQIELESGNVWVNAGEKVYAEISVVTLPTVDINGLPLNATSRTGSVEIIKHGRMILDLEAQAGQPDPVFVEAFSDFKNEPTNQIAEGEIVNIGSKLRPETTALEVLQGITHLFNLQFKTSALLRKVSIEPRDNFYPSIAQANANNKVLDWTKKIEINDDTTLEFLTDTPRYLSLEYKDDSSDAYLKQYKEQNQKSYGSCQIDLGDKFLNSEKKIINPHFASTMTFKDVNAADDPDTPPHWPRMWNKLGGAPEPTYNFQPRVGLFVWQADTTRKWRFQNETNLISSQPMLTMLNVLDTDTPTLLFQDQTDTEGTFNKTGLVDFYNRMFKTIQDGKMLASKFKLSLRDMYNLDMRLLVYLEMPSILKSYYTINRIKDFKPLKRVLTGVELLRTGNFGKFDITPEINEPLEPDASTAGAASGQAIIC